MDNKEYTHYSTDRLNAIPFSSVVELLDTLKRKGVRNVTTCPWHDDAHPSLVLYEGTGENRCHCFACGGGGSVIDYVMQHEHFDFKDACKWLSTSFGVGEEKRRGKRPKRVIKPKPKQEEKEPTYIPMQMVEDMMSTKNSLCRCLMQLFNANLVDYLAEEYMLGIYEAWGHEDCVAFPNIDRWGRVHNIKVQHYCTDMSSEHFCHCDRKGIMWLGTCFVREGLLPADSTFSSHCLFGEHLLSKYPSATVALVESPKNALFGAATIPDMVWVATGNKEAFTERNIQALRGRNVIVYPDHDAYEDWAAKIANLRHVANFVIAKTCENESSLGSKYDIADLIVDWRMQMPL